MNEKINPAFKGTCAVDRCGLSIEIFSSKISQHMIRECLVDVGLVAFLGVFCKATEEVANHGHFFVNRAVSVFWLANHALRQ